MKPKREISKMVTATPLQLDKDSVMTVCQVDV